MKFTKFSDPGHGWLKVPKSLLKKLGIESKITYYSYQKGDFAYLEEDCDEDIFWKALATSKGIEVPDYANARFLQQEKRWVHPEQANFNEKAKAYSSLILASRIEAPQANRKSKIRNYQSYAV